MKHWLLQPAIGRLLANSEEAFEWDVAVPFDPNRYDARTIISMVKLVNRRGRVRWFQQMLDGNEWRWEGSRYNVKGEDDLPTFVDEALHQRFKGRLVVSFEDRSDARAFAHDLDRLSVTPEASEQLRKVQQRKAKLGRKLVAHLTPPAYPESIRFAKADGWGDYVALVWVTMVEPRELQALEIDKWMRRHVRERYWAGVWKPGTGPLMAKLNWRYWRLSPNDWQWLIDSKGADNFIIVNFYNRDDSLAFDAKYGPRKFVSGSLL